MTPESLSRALADFLSGSQSAVVIEDRAILFDLASARYSISGEFNKCLLHLWSNERNLVRRVLDLETKGSNLRLTVQRLGQAHPTKLEFCRNRDAHSPSARRAARAAYEPHLRRALERHFPGLTVNRLTSAIDLEKSFGPVYARGLLGRGQSAFAVLGVNQQESQASVDAALTTTMPRLTRSGSRIGPAAISFFSANRRLKLSIWPRCIFATASLSSGVFLPVSRKMNQKRLPSVSSAAYSGCIGAIMIANNTSEINDRIGFMLFAKW